MFQINRMKIYKVTLFIVASICAVEVICVTTGVFVPEDWLVKHKLFYDYYEPDDEFLYKIKPNLRDLKIDWRREAVSGIYSTDEFGFRNLGRSYSNSRLFFVGDSYIWGSWVSREESICGIVEAELGEPVINLGVGSYDFQRYESIFRLFVAKYKPEIAVLGVFPNDLVETSSFKKGYAGAGEDYYHQVGWDRYRHFPVFQRTATYQLFFAVKNLLFRGKERSGVDQYNDKLNPAKRMASNGITLDQYRGADKDFMKDTSASRHIQYHFDRIINIARENDVELILVLFPSKESTYNKEYQRLFPESADFLGNEEIGYQMLGRQASDKGIACVDLTEIFRQHGKTERLYNELDNHWNPQGNRLAAKEVAILIRTVRIGNVPYQGHPFVKPH